MRSTFQYISEISPTVSPGALPCHRQSSVNEAGQRMAEQNGLFGNRGTNVNLLARLFGRQSPNRTRFCSAPLLTSLEGLLTSLEGLLTSLEGGPCIYPDLV